MFLGKSENSYGSQKKYITDEHLYSSIPKEKELSCLNIASLARTNNAYEHHERPKMNIRDVRFEPMYIDIMDPPKKKTSRKLKVVVTLMAIFSLLAMASVVMTTVMFYKVSTKGTVTQDCATELENGKTAFNSSKLRKLNACFSSLSFSILKLYVIH